MDNATFLVLLDKYFEGSLLPNESEELFEALAQNNEYKDEFTMQNTIKNGIIIFNRKKLRDKLALIKSSEQLDNLSILTLENLNESEKIISKRSKIRKFTIFIISVAALLVVFIVTFLVKTFSTNEVILYNGIVDYDDNINVEIADSSFKIDDNKIKDFESFSNSFNHDSTRDFDFKSRDQMYGYAKQNKKMIKVVFRKNKVGFVVSDSLITLYTNSKDVVNITKLTLISKSRINVYYDINKMTSFNSVYDK